MEAVIMTALIGAFICGGMLFEALAPILPALLGIDRPPGTIAARPAAPISPPRARQVGGLAPGRSRGAEGDRRASDVLELERRVRDLEAERDFYRSLAERPVPDAAAPAKGRGS